MSGNWSTMSVGDKPADVFVPDGGKPRFAMLFLHDQDGVTLLQRPGWSRLLAGQSIACVCPQGGLCWWADRVCPVFDASRTPEQHVVEHIHPWIQREWGLAPGRIALIGVGMGGQGAIRIGLKHPLRFPVVAAIGAAVDQQEAYGFGTPLDEMYPSREHCRQDSAILHVHPARQPTHLWFAADPEDPWYRGNDRLHEKLTALGVAHRFEPTTGCGNGWDCFDRMASPMMAFVVKSLEEESRRLL